ncbi:putative thioredoxin-like protein [Bisporella sp. PMI_857]|nr:putative thioredoxin-like protein [Bisporella sp. PMI_857]
MSVNVGSSAEFSKLLSGTSVVVADFYADWCGPCRAIAPFYESLAKKHSKPKAVAFTKINVDNQKEIAQKYGVAAMPTFMIFRSGSVITTIKGADQRGLSAAVEKAIALAGPAKPVYSSVGRTLGSSTPIARPINFKSFIDTIIAFFGLYLYSLFSFDAYAAAEASPFNIHKVNAPVAPRDAGRRTGAATQVGKKLGTISDFGAN